MNDSTNPKNSLPLDEELSLETLRFLADGKPHSIRQTTRYLKNKLELDYTDKRLKSGELSFNNKIRWIVSYLRHEKLLENTKQGVFQITAKGNDIVTNAQAGPTSILEKFKSEFIEYKTRSKRSQKIMDMFSEKEPTSYSEQYGLVAFLDILGIKGISRSRDPNNLIENKNKLLVTLKELLEDTFSDGLEPKLITFSDTIIITIIIDKAKIKDVLIRFGEMIRLSILHGIKLKIPIRGCFTVGNFSQDSNFFIGEAIDDAAQYYELPQWIGISAAPKAHHILDEMDAVDYPKFDIGFTQYNIPLKNSIESDGWAV